MSIYRNSKKKNQGPKTNPEEVWRIVKINKDQPATCQLCCSFTMMVNNATTKQNRICWTFKTVHFNST